MLRRNFLKTLGIGAAGAALVPGVLRAKDALTGSSKNQYSAEGKDKPNVLLLLADDQTFKSIHAWNNPEVHTPNIDKLFQNGTTFTHAYNQGAWNGAVCVASRAMLNTGRYLFRTGGQSAGNGRYPLWGRTLGKAGYETFMTGKWHNWDNSRKLSFKHLGKHGGGMFRSHKKGTANPYNRPGKGNTWSPSDKSLTGHWRKVNGKIVHSSKLWADESISFLNNIAAKSADPFFMYVAFHAPHDPRQSPKKYVDMYPRNKIKIPKNYMNLHPFDQGHAKIRDEKLAPFPRTKESVKLHLQEYYAIITHADAQIGRILDALDKTGKRDNTIIIFTADHGLSCGRHGLMGKQNQYDHSVRVPLIFSGPGIEKGKKIDTPVYYQSIHPTTLEMAKVPVPKTVDFPSLVPVLQGKKQKVHDYIFGSYMGFQRMVTDTEFKLIRYPHNGKAQLFDLRKDPLELKNLYSDPKYKDKIAELDKAMQKWMTRAGDPMDFKNPKAIDWRSYNSGRFKRVRKPRKTGRK